MREAARARLTAMALRLSPLSAEVTATMAPPPPSGLASSWRTSAAMAWEYLLAGESSTKSAPRTCAGSVISLRMGGPLHTVIGLTFGSGLALAIGPGFGVRRGG